MSVSEPLHVPDVPGVVQVTYAGDGNPFIEAAVVSLQGVRLEHIFAALNDQIDPRDDSSYLRVLHGLRELTGMRSMSVGDLVSLWNRECTVVYGIWRCDSVGWTSILVEPATLAHAS